MNAKHTPGPWRTYSGGRKGPGPWSVETFSRRVADIHESYTDEGVANARLIAAAPDGLTFAEGVLAWLDTLPNSVETRHIRLAAETYIAKATGGQS